MTGEGAAGGPVTLRVVLGCPRVWLLLPLLVAVLTQAGLGPLLDCDATGQASRTAQVSTAAVAPVAVTEGEFDSSPGSPVETGVRAAYAEVRSPDASASVPAPCTHDRPCQHGPVGGGHGAGHAAVRGVDGPRHDGPAPLPASLVPRGSDPPVAPPSVSGPVPPLAVLAPVAVLCVDRN